MLLGRCVARSLDRGRKSPLGGGGSASSGGRKATGLVGGEPRGTVTDAYLEGNEERRVD